MSADGSTSPSSPSPASSPSSASSPGDLAAVERAIAALEAQRAILGDDVVETAVAPLRGRRDQLLAGELGEQRRLVTVLFADLVDFTVLSRRLDPEDTRSVVDACFARWNAAVETQGGVVEKFIGDAVMAVFGLQRSFEDDAERAVRAGLAMTASMAELSEQVEQRFGLGVQMRVGIDTGEVVVSTLGERPGHDFVAVGPTVNRASRLQAAAPVGRVLVSAETYRQARNAVNVEALTGLQLKGLDAPVDAYLIVSERPRGFRMDRGGAIEGVEASTVGRSAELSFLQERFLDVVHDRRYRLVSVVGDAGIGKSRLLRDFDLWLAGQPQEVWWFRGRAAHVGQNRPNSLTRDVIATRMEIQESDPPRVVRAKLEAGFARAYGPGEEAVRAAHVVGVFLGFDLLDPAEQRSPADPADPADPAHPADPPGPAGELVGVPTQPQSVRDQGTLALGQYFARLAQHVPVVILLEDLHWADSASMRLLDDADRLWHDHPVMVVATTRPSLLEDRPRWGDGLSQHVRLTLEALSGRESHRLVRELLQRVDDLPPELVELVVAAGEGNPFYLEELVGWLVDSGVVVPGRPEWRVVRELVGTLAVPPSLKGLLQARLDGLGTHERAVLQRASVVGRVFWDEAVTHLEPGPAGTDRAFDRLRDRDIVFEREISTFASAREFLFKHALLRDVAYDGVLRTHRRTYHRRAALWLAETSARAGRDEEYAALIAEHFDRADDPAAAEWYLRAARRATRVFALDDATALLDRADTLAGSAPSRLAFDVLAVREDVFERVGDRTRQDVDLDRMAALAAVLDEPTCTVTTLLALSRRAFESSAYPEAVDLADRAATAAAGAGLVNRIAEGRLAAGKALTWAEQGAAARERLDEALLAARQAGRTALVAETLRYLAMLASNEGAYPEALARGTEAIAEFAKDGDVEAESTAWAQHGVTLFLVGRIAEARQAFERVLPVFRGSGHVYRQAIAVGNLAAIAQVEGDLTAGEQWATEAIAASDQLGDREGGATNRVVLAIIEIWSNRWPDAREHLVAALRAVTDVGTVNLEVQVRSTFVVGLLEHADPEPAQAVRFARSVVEAAASELVSPLNRAAARLVLGYALLAAGSPADARVELSRSPSDFLTGVGAPALERDGLLVAVDLAERPTDGPPVGSTRALARSVVERLDSEVLTVVLRPPSVVTALSDALSGSDEAADVAAHTRLIEVARAHLRRHLDRPDGDPGAAGFRRVPSVARLITLVGPDRFSP